MKALHIGLTGAIGSGKSTVAAMLHEIGVPVYVADDAAKRLMVEDEGLKAAIEDAFGPGIYVEGQLQRKTLAQRAFSSPEDTARINALVHPAVHADFVAWHAAQTAPYILREAAILFESGTYQTCDAIVVVEASKEVRIQRVMARSGMTREEVEQRMQHQWPDAKRRAHLSDRDFIVQNDEDEASLRRQVDVLHEELLQRCSR